MCSGRQETSSRTVANSVSEPIPSTPKITSTLILPKPALRSASKARRAQAASCRRFIQRSMASSRDCTPMLTRLTPSARSSEAYPADTSSGLTSTVHSRQLRPPQASAIAPSHEEGSTDGVPPPKYSVSTAAVASISLRLARASAQTSSTHALVGHALSE